MVSVRFASFLYRLLIYSRTVYRNGCEGFPRTVLPAGKYSHSKERQFLRGYRTLLSCVFFARDPMAYGVSCSGVH